MLRAMSGSTPGAADTSRDTSTGSRSPDGGVGIDGTVRGDVPGYMDLHAHYLPAIDDGAADLRATAQMVEGVVGLGFSHLFATPHQRQGLYLPTRAAILAAFERMTVAFEAGKAPVFGLGAENFWDETFLGRVHTGEVPCYDDGPAFLFEVPPPLMPAGIESVLFGFRMNGKLPVMAHPERYHSIQARVDRARTLGQSAALLVDLAALDGAHGRAEMKTARQLLTDGLAHAAATDIHSVDDLNGIAGGIAWIRKHLGPEALRTLLADNPRRIVAGELPERGS
jgi:protein-tyrosine phosphatase